MQIVGSSRSGTRHAALDERLVRACRAPVDLATVLATLALHLEPDHRVCICLGNSTLTGLLILGHELCMKPSSQRYWPLEDSSQALQLPGDPAYAKLVFSCSLKLMSAVMLLEDFLFLGQSSHTIVHRASLMRLSSKPSSLVLDQATLLTTPRLHMCRLQIIRMLFCNCRGGSSRRAWARSK